MADKVKLRALRTIQRVGELVQPGQRFEVSEMEARTYLREKNPLAEEVRSKSSSSDDEDGEKKSTKKSKKK